MKRTYSLFQQYIAFVLLVSFLLQSCGGGFDNNPLIPIQEGKTPLLQKQESISFSHTGPLADQTLIAQGGHAVTFREEAGALVADVEMNAPQGFSKTYEGLEVTAEQGAELAKLPCLDKKAQQRRIHLQLAKEEQPARVVIYKGAGLAGGMQVDGGSEGQAQFIRRLVDFTELRRCFNRGNLEITPANYKLLLEFAQRHALSFQSYDRGVVVKGWEASGDFSELANLLLSFTSIKVFKFNVGAQEKEAEIAEVIARAVQFYEDMSDLDISGCKLNDATIQDTIQSIPYPEKLKFLNISNNQVSAKLVSTLKESFPHTQITFSSVNSLAQQLRTPTLSSPKPTPFKPLPTLPPARVAGVKERGNSTTSEKGVVSGTPNRPNASVREKSGLLQAMSKLELSDLAGSSVQRLARGNTVSTSKPITAEPLLNKPLPIVVPPRPANMNKREDIIPNEKEDVPTLTRKAQQGDVKAQQALGVMYESGNGVTKDVKKAVEWYQKAAMQGHVEAQCNLGGMYELGRGIGKDEHQATYWYQKAADQGYAKAQYKLGMMYELGRGIAKDENQALHWYQKAAGQGNSIAQRKVKELAVNDKGWVKGKDSNLKGYKKSGEQIDASEQVNLGVAYYNGQGVQQDYVKAKECFAKAADQGNMHAQNWLGFMYQHGQGGPQNYQEAIKWFQKAADQGLADAQNNLGFMYQNGYGLSQNYQEAIKWFQKAADQGLAAAQNSLGFMYQNGYGLSQNYQEAIKWYQKAAEQGHADAQNNLGFTYQNGYGLSQNYQEAIKWYQKAAEQGNMYAQNWLGFMYENGQGVEKNYRKAIEWYQKAADQGYAYAQYNLGDMYDNGKGVSQNYQEAIKWYQKAAEKGNAAAQCGLGFMYENGLGVAQSYEGAVKWYQKGAEQENMSGKANLGRMYYEGKGIMKDIVKANKLFQEAVSTIKNWAEKGDIGPQNLLGWMYQYGQGVGQNDQEAVLWYQKAAKQEHIVAQFRLASMYEHGQGVTKDLQEATKWYQKAADQRLPAAQEWLKNHGQYNQQEVKQGKQPEALPETINSKLEEVLTPLKEHFKTEAPQASGAWQAAIPTKDITAVLSPLEQKALTQADKIVVDYNAKYCQNVTNLSRFSKAKQQFSKAFAKTVQVSKDAVLGPDINSLKKLQQDVNAAYGSEVLKLDAGRLERNHAERSADVTVSHQKREEELDREQDIVSSKLKTNLTPHLRGELRKQQAQIAAQLAEEHDLHEVALKRLASPAQSAIEDFYDWKRSVFHDFTKLHLGNYLITYEALALGTVARHPEAYENILQGSTAIGSVLADAFLPLGGLLGNVIGKTAEISAQLYADKQMRIKAAKIGSLYGHKGLEGMVALTQEVADALLFRLKDVIIDLTPESMDKLAKVATTQMIDYALKMWERNDGQTINAMNLLLGGTQHQPSWLKAFTQTARLETEDGRYLDGWSLLVQGEQVISDEGRFMRAAHFFAKQAKKNGGAFMGYAGQGGSAISGLVGF
ncbi:hypothetical protein Aasi_0895 [Candidatus Amoebophilus asiaticus 5a2]|uniref:Uncharacterized protein n=1 Tax=Amoebophilus asiaticus (strain 5a2) TaxID=452471 RepID=B3ESR0_AMOA5|nr:SEL1-like repeat protein [Candidatus Amoebophilus asiaticus]ACE06262.1 hypothetical protein Aasi_0895 [Candidatus Amoebophilus asiaticus 5a2]